MADVRIENPILNSPFREPERHFQLTDDGITGEVVEGRRSSDYFVPIPQARTRTAQASFEDAFEQRQNEFINAVRQKVGAWRQRGRPDLTPTSRALLDYWTDPHREKPLFFCQIEALETAMYLLEAAPHDTGTRFDGQLREMATAHNPGLYRIAFKMATGSGKTVVMAMLIAWQTLNKLDRPRDARFTDAFLVVAPGITIRDRLRVLQPQAPDNYYDARTGRDLVTPDQLRRLYRAEVVIANYHQFLLREKDVAGSRPSRLGRSVLQPDASAFRETPDEMVIRVCAGLRTRGEVVVLNDEAHHCYLPKPPDPGDDVPALKGDEKREADADAEVARVWAGGLQHVVRKLGVKAVYDLSATPFFLDGSGYRSGQLFPWVVSDFSLTDAIESGIVKIPRVPVDDDAVAGDEPLYRVLWPRIRAELPKRAGQITGGEPHLPQELEAALESLYGSYVQSFARWQERTAASGATSAPPVFIVVCQNTAISKLVFDWIAGWEAEVEGSGDDGPVTVLHPGKLDLFSNVEQVGPGEFDWRPRPNTILIDSRQLESGEGMSDAFKKIAAAEIEDFKRELAQRIGAADVDKLTDDALLREVMNTVGQPGKLGGDVRCVVSVSMLTEGWDARTVTHILGVRAFGTQLLCEQVVGRGLRRVSYDANDQGHFEPEYAEVYGVPFQFLPTSGAGVDPPPPPELTIVQSVPGRDHLRIEFPHVVGYRFEFPEARLMADLDGVRPMELSSAEIPSVTEIADFVGGSEEHALDRLRARRRQEVEFEVAAEVLRRFTAGSGDKPVLFPQVLAITKEWIERCVVVKDGGFLQLLLLADKRHAAAERIVGAISQAGEHGEPLVVPVLRDFDASGSTDDVSFETGRETWLTPDGGRSPLNRVTCDSGWEKVVAQRLEQLDGVRAYVKNDHLGFAIPYTIEGLHRRYLPDFLVSLDVPEGEPAATLVVEVSGEDREDKAVKVETARDLWVPAVNQHGGWGRWAFVEVTDPTDVLGPLTQAVARYIGQDGDDQEARLARFRAAVEVAAGTIPRLPPGKEYVEELRAAERERERMLEERWRGPSTPG